MNRGNTCQTRQLSDDFSGFSLLDFRSYVIALMLLYICCGLGYLSQRTSFLSLQTSVKFRFTLFNTVIFSVIFFHLNKGKILNIP